MRAISSLFALLFVLCLASAGAATLPVTPGAVPTSTAQPPARPKICVVLSGGGARGFAHLGVLRYLEQHHIPIDCIAGTSMGAVIGGLYASGMSSDEIEQRINAIRLGDVALDIVDRRQLSQSLREDDQNYPISATFGVSQDGVTLPLGAIQANQFMQLLHNWTAQIPPDIAFDHLPIPFRCVATDLETGNMVVFDHGPLHLAIRASMAAPGVFAPIELNGRLLTDGGLVRNLPVDVARGMGADVIIASNIGTSLLPRSELKGLVNISKQMMSILTEQNVNEQKGILLPTDVLIDPDLGDIGFMDFPRASEASDIGYRATAALQSKLATLELDEGTYLAQLKARPNPALHEVRITFVDIKTTGKVPPDDIRRQLNIPIGSIYSSDRINQLITPLINSRQYDSITHALVERDGEYGVEINVRERAWGPNFVRVGLAMQTGFDGQSGFEIQLGHRLPWLTEGGLELRDDLELGTIYGIRSELRQPVSNREGVYLAPWINFQQKPLYLFAGDNPIAEYHMQTAQAGLDFGIPIGEFSHLGEWRAGLIATHYSLRPKLGGVIEESNDQLVSVGQLPWVKMNEYAFHTHFTIDQLDTPVFPRDGYLVGAELFSGINQNRADSAAVDTHSQLRPYQQLTFNSTLASSAEDHSVNLSVLAGARYQSGSPIPGVGLSLGGFQKLTAYQPDQFIGNYLVYGNATYLYRAVNFGMAGEAAFLGTSFEIGNAANQKSDFDYSQLKKSWSLFMGANTFMGPVHFGFALAPGREFNLFLQLGNPTP